jgi:hypothetical protein
MRQKHKNFNNIINEKISYFSFNVGFDYDGIRPRYCQRNSD